MRRQGRSGGKGAAAAGARAHTDMLAAEASLLDGLPPRERTALAGLLATLAASLEHRQVCDADSH